MFNKIEKNWPFYVCISFICFYLAYLFLLHWNWGLMDDVGFIQTRLHQPLTTSWLFGIVKKYFEEGRFYPIGVFFKHLTYMLLPASVFAHRLLRFIQFCILGIIFVKGISNKIFKCNRSIGFALIVWFSAFCFRDGLDTYSTVEVHGCIYGFLAIANVLRTENITKKHIFGSVILCILATLTKEPFIAYFGVVGLILVKRLDVLKNKNVKAFLFSALPIFCAAVIALVLYALKHTYTAGFGQTLSINTITSIFYTVFRNYHLLIIALIILFLMKKIRFSYWSFVFLSGFFAYAFIISLWGTSDTFLYLHIPALPLFAIGIAALTDDLLDRQDVKASAVLLFISLIFFMQTIRGGIRSYIFNQESDSVSQMLTLYNPTSKESKLWTNCEEASGTLIRYSEYMYGRTAKGILSVEPRWMYRLFETKENVFPKENDWIVESKKCFPYNLDHYPKSKVYSGTFYNIYEVKK